MALQNSPPHLGDIGDREPDSVPIGLRHYDHRYANSSMTPWEKQPRSDPGLLKPGQFSPSFLNFFGIDGRHHLWRGNEEVQIRILQFR